MAKVVYNISGKTLIDVFLKVIDFARLLFNSVVLCLEVVTYFSINIKTRVFRVNQPHNNTSISQIFNIF
jgi:hypothetical protein